MADEIEARADGTGKTKSDDILAQSVRTDGPGLKTPKVPKTKAQELIEQSRQQAAASMMAGPPGGLMTDSDNTSNAIMELFRIPDDLTQVDTIKDLMVKTDLDPSSIRPAARALTLSQLFDDPDNPNFVSIPRLVIGWTCLGMISRDRRGRMEYAEVLGHQFRSEQSELGSGF